MPVKRTLGIDLSSDPKKTAACLIAWDGRRAEIEELHWGGDEATPLTDDDLLALIARAHKTGIDAPFGWPVEFVAAVRAWERGAPWPDSASFVAYRHRLTDRQINDPRPPLSVSSDLVAVTAMRCARLLSRLGQDVDRAGQHGPVVELYPAAALKAWGLPLDPYKKAKGKAARRRLVDALRRRIEPFCPMSSEQRLLCERYDDALDAIVASLVVRARMLGLTRKPTRSQLDRARVEGWIHVPTCDLAELAG